MSITIRPVTDGDFFPWLGLYEGYATFYDVELTDERALLVWSWIVDANNELSAQVAVDDETGELIGLVHYREFPRPLHNSRGLWVDDLFVADESRRQGIAGDLLNTVAAEARSKNCSVVRWITAEDNESARALYDRVGTKTDWVTYDIEL